MTIWINYTPEKRIKYWRDYREFISVLPLEEQITSVAQFFSNVPIGARTIDYYTPSSWPTPWEILYYKTYCKNTISILMYDTLQILNNTERLTLCLINDEMDTYLAPVVDNQTLLNHIIGEVSTLCDDDLNYSITVYNKFPNLQRKY